MWWWDVLRPSLPVLYSMGGKVTDLRNLILADYNSRIRRWYDIYPNRLGFLDHRVVFACSAWFTEQFGDPRGPFWQVGPPRLAWPMYVHEGIRVYTPVASPRVLCILMQHVVLILRPVRLKVLEHPTRRVVCRGIFPPFRLVQLITDHHTSRKTPCQKNAWCSKKKEKPFIFDEVCPHKFHCGKLTMRGTIGSAIMSRDMILRI
jgi:hypothetical protein